MRSLLNNLITVHPRRPLAANAARSFAFRAFSAALFATQNGRCSRGNVSDQRFEAARLRFAHVQRLLRNYEEVVDEVGWWRNVERDDLAWAVDGWPVGLFVEKYLLSRLVVCRPGDLLISLQPLPELRIFFLQLPDLCCLVLGPHDCWQWHRLENRGQKVVQAEEASKQLVHEQTTTVLIYLDLPQE